jgi:hypothetical protein
MDQKRSRDRTHLELTVERAAADSFFGEARDTVAKPLAIIIEPRRRLATALADVVSAAGFEAAIAASHDGAAALAEGRCPLLLLACVPAPDAKPAESYLAACRQGCGEIATVVMLSDRSANCRGAPSCAVPIVEPFSKDELIESMERAQLAAHLSLSETATPNPACHSVPVVRCAHEGCYCTRPRGGPYCSDICQGAAQAAVTVSVADGSCGCNHDYCGDERSERP